MGKFFVIMLFMFSCFLSLCSPSYALIPVYKVKKILAPNIFELSNGKKISLLGINIKNGKENEVSQFIKKLVSNSKVVVINDSETDVVDFDKEITPVYLYLWGNHQAYELADEASVLKKGFLNVKTGFWNVQKGIGVNLNGLLIKYGYAIVDQTVDFKDKKNLIDLEEQFQK